MMLAKSCALKASASKAIRALAAVASRDARVQRLRA
jgi:hypothetical protein